MPRRPRRGAGSGERGCPPRDGSGEWAAGLCVRLLFIRPESADDGSSLTVHRPSAEGAGHGTGMIGRACAVAEELPAPRAREGDAATRSPLAALPAEP